MGASAPTPTREESAMTKSEYLAALTLAGFTHKPLFGADEPGNSQATITGYAIYAPDGLLLTSIAIRSYMARDRKGIAVYFCSEGNDILGDVEDLKGIWAQQMARRRANRTA